MAISKIVTNSLASGVTLTSPTLVTPVLSGSVTGTYTLAGTPIVATTLGVGGATPSASGSGISFPATQSASTDVNTLDDYEEGTWTCTASGQVSTGVGTYVKIGSLVYVACVFSCNTNAAASGALQIGGFPFSTSSTASGAAPIAIDTGNAGASGNVVAAFATGVSPYIFIDISTTAHYIRCNSTGSNPYYNNSLFKSGTTFNFQFTYRAA